jgi:RNA polymerase sporulation-specific sigma factor
MNYRELNDNELLSYIAEAHEDAEEILYHKYSPLIHSSAKRMYTYCKNTGLELNDLVQEGMLGLNQAITTYKDNKDTMFFTYAKTCIERKIISLVVASTRQKHRILNNSLSFETEFEDHENSRLENVIKDTHENPEEALINSETEEELINKIKITLTDLESQVFELKLNYFNYKEIAEILDKEPKTIDNAIQRIRMKAKKIMEM